MSDYDILKAIENKKPEFKPGECVITTNHPEGQGKIIEPLGGGYVVEIDEPKKEAYKGFKGLYFPIALKPCSKPDLTS